MLVTGFGDDSHDGLGVGGSDVDPALGPIDAQAVTAIIAPIRSMLTTRDLIRDTSLVFLESSSHCLDQTAGAWSWRGRGPQLVLPDRSDSEPRLPYSLHYPAVPVAADLVEVQPNRVEEVHQKPFEPALAPYVLQEPQLTPPV